MNSFLNFVTQFLPQKTSTKLQYLLELPSQLLWENELTLK